MRLKKLLAISALIPALLLTGCTGDNSVPSPTQTSTTPATSNGFKWTDAQLAAYMQTPAYYDASTTIADKIHFTPDTPENKFDLETPQVTVAAWQVNEYIKKAYDNGYFLANWWGTKDNHKQTGIQEVSQLTTPKYQEQYAHNADLLRKDPKNTEATNWFNPRIFMPTTQPDYMVFDTCQTDWVMEACRLNPPEIDGYNATRDKDGNIVITTNVTVTPLYNQVIDGSAGVAPRTYALTFKLTPNMKALPKMLTEEQATAWATKAAEKGFKPEDYKPYLYLIWDIEGTVTNGMPVAY